MTKLTKLEHAAWCVRDAHNLAERSYRLTLEATHAVQQGRVAEAISYLHDALEPAERVRFDIRAAIDKLERVAAREDGTP